jgi:hypothetical protein
MRKIYVFTTPPRNMNSEDYELFILDRIRNKFRLGELLDYDSYSEENIQYLIGQFTGGKVMVKFKEQGEAIALIKIYKKGRISYRY